MLEREKADFLDLQNLHKSNNFSSVSLKNNN